jgi:hypothetical protein
MLRVSEYWPGIAEQGTLCDFEFTLGKDQKVIHFTTASQINEPPQTLCMNRESSIDSRWRELEDSIEAELLV